MALSVGDTVAGRYLLVERLGAGGMGVVFRARDATLDRDIALKALLPHVGQDPALLERFRREARVLAMLRNPGIITVFDLVTTDGGDTALILEYVGGGSLEDQIARGPMEWRRVAQVGVAAAEALAEAHEAGVVHRDIKPSNLLLEPDGAVRIADFGIASIAGEVTMSGQGESIGTPAYMSPEQAMGQAAGPASDVYSLGAVLFAAATGRVPFPTAEGGFAAALAHINQPVPDPRAIRPELPDAAAAVIMRAMQKDPAARFASAAEFAASLRAAAALATSDIPVPMLSTPPSDGPPTPPPPKAPAGQVPPPPEATPVPPPPAPDATQVVAATPPPPTTPPTTTPPPPSLPPMPPIPPPPAPSLGGAGNRRGILIGGISALAVILIGGLIAFIVTRSGSSDAGPVTPTTTATSSPPISPSASPSVGPTTTTPTVEPVDPTPTATESLPNEGSYAEPFTADGWGVLDNEAGAVTYRNDTMIISVRRPSQGIVVTSPVDAVRDVSMVVDASYDEFTDPRQGEMGLMCRYQDPSNQYRLGVRSDGAAFIYKVVDDVSFDIAFEPNALGGFLPAYKIEAQCIGSQLTLYVNGEVVATGADVTFPTGQSGVYAATTDVDSGTASVFSNYVQLWFESELG